MSHLKINYIGIVGGILAFISVALSWWTFSASAGGISTSVDLYIYQTGTLYGTTTATWYTWSALALIIIGGLLGLVGSLTAMGKKVLIGGGVLALLSIVIFAVGLQMDLSNVPVSGIGLFSSGSISIGTISVSWSTYLSYGFWLALVAMILMFVGAMRAPTETAAAPQPT